MNNIPRSQIHPALMAEKSRKLNFNEYIYIGDENPERVYRQAVAGQVSGNQITFRAHPPVPNLLLSAKAWVKYTFSITKFKSVPIIPATINFEETDANIPTNGDVILTKPFMAIANSTRELKIGINGKAVVYNEPRYFQKYIGQLFCPEDDIKKYFSTCGGPYPSNSGAYEPDEPRVDINNGSSGDEGFDMSADLTFEQYAFSTGASPQAEINFYEPLYGGPFNWGFDIKERLPDKFWGKKMSDLIPYVRDLDISITVRKLAENCFYYQYGQTSGAGNERLFLQDIGMESAELILQWVKPKDLEISYEKPYPNIHGIATTMLDSNSKILSIPEEVKLQSWNLRHHVFDVNNGEVLLHQANTTLNIPVINMYQVPSYVLMFATTDKDDVNYQCVSATFSDSAGVNSGTSFDTTSIETNPSIRELTININNDSGVINNRYETRELYNITLKNAKKDYPYDFAKYLGSRSRRANYPGNMCVLFSAEDLNIPMTTGRLTTDFIFSATVLLRGESGHYVKASTSDQVYRFHIFFLYDKYYMKINSKGDVDFRYESIY